MIRKIWEMTASPQFTGHVFVIEDYDIGLGRHLVGGADAWLNTPRPPMEASGTSGMKAAANGGLNISVADGWWLEGADSNNGWNFGEDHSSDEVDAHTLYDLLESEVAPAFYERNEAELPMRWITMMRQALTETTPRFSARRMVAEYAQRLYVDSG